MCLGYPARVVEVEGTMLVVDDRARLRRASTPLATDLEVGDWVLVAAGNVIRRLDPEDAADLGSELARAESIADAEGPTPDSDPPAPRPQGESR